MKMFNKIFYFYHAFFLPIFFYLCGFDYLRGLKGVYPQEGFNVLLFTIFLFVLVSMLLSVFWIFFRYKDNKIGFRILLSILTFILLFFMFYLYTMVLSMFIVSAIESITLLMYGLQGVTITKQLGVLLIISSICAIIWYMSIVKIEEISKKRING